MSTPQEYLEARVETANSAQLHLMLLDGALRHAREAEKGILRGEELGYHAPLRQAMEFTGELLAGVRHNKSELNEKLGQLYAYTYTRLTSAYVNGDKAAIAEAIKVLEIEQETWRMAVAKLTADPQAGQPNGTPAAEGTPAAKKAPAPKPHLGSTQAAAPTQGLSLEA